MNTSTQVLFSQRIQTNRKSRLQNLRVNFLMIFLITLSLLSAFTLIYLKDLNRRLFIEYQQLQDTRQQYETNWGKLLLEQSTWSTQARIQSLAQKRLAMIYPNQKNIVIVEE